MKFRPFFRWFDLWIGAYWSADTRTLYLCPLPMVGVAFTFGPRRTLYAELSRIGFELKPVDMHPGSWWNCPVCSREHFARQVRFEGSPEEIAEMREKFGLDEGEGEFVHIPDTVECPACRLTFKTIDDNAPESEAA